jgi:outer membrane scaffolding protein for murein synthesis (MipA/OmpV family)
MEYMMNKNKLKYGTIGLAALLLAPAAHAEIAVPVEGLDVNILGIAVASVPDYWGSSENEGAVGLYGRYQFQDSQRYVQLLGPELTVNLLNDSNWRLGPIIRYRSARDSDVDDKIVSEMDEVDSAIEGGVFLTYKLPLSEMPLHQITFSGDIEGGKNGTEGHLKVNYFQPFSKTIIGNIGLGMTYGNSKFMENYFGVTSQHDINLYPSLNGNEYDASSGIASWNIPFGVSVFLTPEWLLSVGGRYERLVSDAKDSPVVDQRGDANQWIGGVGIAYVFK